jgi:hypothetical protein
MLLLFKIILEDMRIKLEGLNKLSCNNKSAISITHNLMQHDRIKHIEIDNILSKRN